MRLSESARARAQRRSDGMSTETGESRRTAFHEIMSPTASGFDEEAGWFWVTGFGDPEREYKAVREGVGVWDVSPSTSGTSVGRTRPRRPSAFIRTTSW